MKLKDFVECWTNSKSGYIIELWFTDNNKPYIISQHIRVFLEHYGRKPKKGYDIHHIDGDKTNNSIDNLLEIERSQHKKLHNKDMYKGEHYYKKSI